MLCQLLPEDTSVSSAHINWTNGLYSLIKTVKMIANDCFVPSLVFGRRLIWRYFLSKLTKTKTLFQALASLRHPHLPKNCFIYFNESPMRMMKSAFYFLKTLFVLKIIKFLCWLFVHVEKTAWLERSG